MNTYENLFPSVYCCVSWSSFTILYSMFNSCCKIIWRRLWCALLYVWYKIQ